VPDRTRQTYCPPEYKNRIYALTDLIRWGPSTFTHAEFLILSYYAERTLTYGKASDASSMSQITEGIFSRASQEWIRGHAGLSATAVKKANKSLSSKGFLVRRHAVLGETRYRPDHGNEATEYEINWSALHAEFGKRKRTTLGHVVTKPPGRLATNPLGHQVPNNRGKSSSEDKENRGKPSAQDKSSRVAGQATERGRPQQAHRGPLMGDDEETVSLSFVNPKAELAYLIERRGGLLSEFEWRGISEQLELKRVDLADFVIFLRPHLLNPKTTNPLGMVKSKLKKYASMTRSALTQADLGAPEAEPAAREKCPICKSVKGNGTLLVGDRLVACECATDEWRAKVERQEEERLQRAGHKDQDKP
jgi:hypothetical protein